MKDQYITQRIVAGPLSTNDAAFIMELVNTPGWLKFIGNRNVGSAEDAQKYIRKILDNPNVKYWVVRSKEENTPMGIITFIKRDYLDHWDLGFAFLPSGAGKGYAYEAAYTVLTDLLNDPGHQQIMATTVKDNTRSIRLLEKMGFRFAKDIPVEKETLSLYSISK